MSEPNSPSDPFSNIPTAPTIEVRTLHGDVQSMSSRGGTAMQIEDVTDMINRKAPLPVQPKEGSGLLFKIIVLVLVILIAALAVAFIVGSGVTANVPAIKNIFSLNSPTTTPTTSLPAYIPTSSTVNFDPYADIEPQRFLRIPADTSFTMVLSKEAAQTAEDLLTFSQKLAANLKTIPSQSHFIEIELEKDGGKPADGLTFMSLSGINIFTSQFFAENFSPNMMAFVYRDSRGSWPGYIFKLLPGKTPRLVNSQVQFIERSPGTLNPLFLSDPGAPTGVFTDGQRSGLPTREQSYSASGAAIGYAWQDQYLVISTSLDGLSEALHRLQG